VAVYFSKLNNIPRPDYIVLCVVVAYVRSVMELVQPNVRYGRNTYMSWNRREWWETFDFFVLEHDLLLRTESVNLVGC
jgi:hypothetical protein